MSNVALIIIYNHQYNKNIELVEKIYGQRFRNIYHLVPFYNGNKSNVIPVYENSYYFQGYLAQGFKSYFNEKYEHYFFIADDMLLNPIINESNYKDHFNLTKESCFLPEFIQLHEMRGRWPRLLESFMYKSKLPGLEINGQLPTYEDAIKLFNNFGLAIKPLDIRQLWRVPDSMADWKFVFKSQKRNFFKYIKLFFTARFGKTKYDLPYPLVGSYSDICIISSDSIQQFSHYAGVFAASRLFVEVALPTALVLSAKEIVTEKSLQLKGKALWPDGSYRLNGDPNPVKGDYTELEKYKFDIHTLLNNFPENYIYLHPIKLSKWKM